MDTLGISSTKFERNMGPEVVRTPLPPDVSLMGDFSLLYVTFEVEWIRLRRFSSVFLMT